MTHVNGIKAEGIQTNGRGRVELITLPDKTNPKAFADELKAAGAAKEIEYIQPDFVLSLDSLYLEIAEDMEDIGDTENPEPKEYVEPDVEPIESMESTEPVEPEEEEEELLDVQYNSTVLVAVIDTGVDASHPMLEDAMTEGWNFIN